MALPKLILISLQRTTGLTLFILLFLNHISVAQLKERFILSDTKDSSLIKAGWCNFDVNGDYLIAIEDNGHYYFVNKAGKTDPLKYKWGGTITLFKSIADEEQNFYKGSSSTLFGPISGTDMSSYKHPQSENEKHLAVACLQQDSISIFIDGKIRLKIDTFSGTELKINSIKASSLEAKKNYFDSDDWLSFSNNGNYIFSVENNMLYRLYVNQQIIDSSQNGFSQLRINNNGDYTYLKASTQVNKKSKDYKLQLFTYNQDSFVGDFGFISKYELRENGGYYCKGSTSGTNCILINNSFHENLNSIDNITIIDKKNYLFTCYKDKTYDIIVNDNLFSLPFTKIYCPALDENGNFSLYGIRDYYLYKYVNGKEIEPPISNYGVRAIPLYISPTGESLHLFQTDDSTYIFRDQNQILPAFHNSKNFYIKDYSEEFPYDFIHDESNNGKSLLYIEIDTVGYFIFNGKFSAPMLPLENKTYLREKTIGEIVAGKFNHNGFFAIQKIGEEKFMVNVNNKVYQELDDVQEILGESCYFDERKLTLFCIKGLSFYQYTLTL